LSWRRPAFYAAAGLLLLSPLEAPQLLAFPYVEQIGGHRIYSEAPIAPELKAVVRAGDTLLLARRLRMRTLISRFSSPTADGAGSGSR
jgi:hypothetical protein